MILILGGTREARDLAARLHSTLGQRVVTSLAGRLADPVAPAGDLRVGGFGGVAGLAGYLSDHGVAALVDATHPFAARMSANAAAAARLTGTPLVRLTRPGWAESAGDCWHRVPDMRAAVAVLPTLGRRVFATTGTTDLEILNLISGTEILLRCVETPPTELGPHVRVILGRGPFSVAAERELFAAERIDVLLTKDSGGAMTGAKLEAARDLGLPVVMVDRPASPSGEGPQSADSVEAAVRLLGFAR